MPSTSLARNRQNHVINRLDPGDRAAHEWYRFVLAYPPHLVRDYLARFEIAPGQTVLDPFCGTGTTLVEAKKRDVGSVGVEANPMAHLAASVKVEWRPDPDALVAHAEGVAGSVRRQLTAAGIGDDLLAGMRPPSRIEPGMLRGLAEEQEQLILGGSISPLPLHKVLVLVEHLDQASDSRFVAHERIALARALVGPIGNLHFGPEVGVGPAKRDAPVLDCWLANVRQMAGDLRRLRDRARVPAVVHLADARRLSTVLPAASIDAVITSPPYPNEKDYTRTTRLESVLLGLIRDRADLRALKAGLLRSNTRNVYKGDSDDTWVAEYPAIQRIAAAIEERRLALGKTSGFERQYARVTKLYFGGMARHLADLRTVLRPGAHLAYVVGDQASYLRILIRTGTVLAEIACALGYELVGIDLWRTRLATATREQLREEVVVLRWPGGA